MTQCSLSQCSEASAVIVTSGQYFPPSPLLTSHLLVLALLPPLLPSFTLLLLVLAAVGIPTPSGWCLNSCGLWCQDNERSRRRRRRSVKKSRMKNIGTRKNRHQETCWSKTRVLLDYRCWCWIGQNRTLSPKDRSLRQRAARKQLQHQHLVEKRKWKCLSKNHCNNSVQTYIKLDLTETCLATDLV